MFCHDRTVFLKLASLIVLVYTIYVEVNCSPKDDCNVGIGKPDGKCSELRVRISYSLNMLLWI